MAIRFIQLLNKLFLIMKKLSTKEKDLLLKDLCSRLPYGVKMNHIADNEHSPKTLIGIAKDMITLEGPGGYECVDIEHYKPYLFPLSSMTEKQKEELFFSYIHNDIYFDDFTDYFLAGELWHDICVSMDILPELIVWLNKNHFDYNDLILKGLAIDAINKNIY